MSHPETFSRYLLKDGRKVEVIGVDWYRDMTRPVALRVERQKGKPRPSPEVIYMSHKGFWSRVKAKL